MSAVDFDQREVAKYLLSLRKASESFTGFMDFYYPDMEWPAFIREYQEVLDLLEKDALVSKGGNPIRQVLVTMPPRHAKSFTGTINFPGYALMRKPTREVMVGSYNNEMAGTFGRGTRDIVTSKKVAKAFPNVKLSRETRAVDFWKTMDGGAYYSIGMGGTSTGRGANILAIDDPYKTREEAESITVRRKVWNEYVATFRTRMQPSIDGQAASCIVTHTRWHPDDLAGRIMETPEFKAGEWLHLNFQALTVKNRGVFISRSHLPASDPRYVPDIEVELEDGRKVKPIQLIEPEQREVSMAEEQALWPQRFPVDWLHKQKSTIGAREFESLYQQSPYVIGGNLIKEKWLKRYKADELPEFAALAMTADTAHKAGTRNDYSVFSLGGITEGGDIYLLRVWREKLEFPDLKRKAISLYAAHRGKGLRGLWVEDAASGQSLLQELNRESGIAVLPWKPGASDKVARVNMGSPLMEAGRVFIPEECDWLDAWLEEVIAFPSAKHDDQVDSFIMLLDVLSRMVVVGSSDWAEPIGTFIATNKDMAGAGAFTGQPLVADANGWLGKGGFAAAAQLGQDWQRGFLGS